MTDDNPPIDPSDDVWIGGADSVDGEQFIEALDVVVDLQDTLAALQEDLAEMDTGLDREDTIRLLKGRNMQVAIDDIEAFFDAVETVIESEPSDIAPRLIQSRVSDMTIEEAAEMFDEVVKLAEKYGSLNHQTEEDQ